MMKKFFNVEKWKTKNRNIVEVLNTLMGWMFFAVACCVALFVCFYSFGNDNVVYGAEADYPLKIEFCNINGELLDNQSIENFCEEMYYSADDGTNWHNWQNDGIKIGSGSVQVKIKNRKLKTTTSYYCAMGEDGNVIGETANLSFEGSLEPSEEIITISLDNLNLTGNVGSICIRFLVVNKFVVTLKGNQEGKESEKYRLADRATVSFRGNLIEANNEGDYTINDVEIGVDKSIIVTPKLGYIFNADKTASSVNVKLVKSDGNDENVQCDLKTEEEKHHPVKSIIIDISKFTEDTTFKIDNIKFDTYKIKFMSEIGDYNDENGFVKNDVAKVYIENSESPSDIKSISVTCETPQKFTVKMENKYNESNINLKLLTAQNDQETKPNEEKPTAGSAVIKFTLGDDEIKYYADKEYIEIYICNITVNKYDVKFSLDGDKGNFSDIADIKICEYKLNGSGSDYEEPEKNELNYKVPDSNGSYTVSSYCPYGKNFTFRIELKKWYKFNIDGLNEGEKIYDSSDAPIKKLILNIDSIKSDAINGKIEYEFKKDDKSDGSDAYGDAYAYVTVTLTDVIGDLEIRLNSSNITGYGYKLMFFKSEDIYSSIDLTSVKKEADDSDFYIKCAEKDTLDKSGNTYSVTYGVTYYFFVNVVGDGEIKGNILTKTDKERLESLGVKVQEISEGIIRDYLPTGENYNINNTLSKSRIIEVTFSESLNPNPTKWADIWFTNVIEPDQCVVVDYPKGQVKDLTAESFVNSSSFFGNNFKCTYNDEGKEVMKQGVKIGYDGTLEVKIEPEDGENRYNFSSESDVKIYEMIKNADNEYVIKRTDENGNKLDIGDPDDGGDYTNKVPYKKEYSAGALIIKVKKVRKSFCISVIPDRDKVPLYFNETDGMKYYGFEKDESGEFKDYEIKGTVTVPQGSSYIFAVKANKGFNIESVKKIEGTESIKINSDTNLSEDLAKIKKCCDDKFSSGNYKLFEIKNISESKNISGTINRFSYKLKFDKDAKDPDGNKINDTNVVTYLQDGNKILGDSSVLYGDSFSFQISLSEKYNQSDFKVYVSDGSSADREIIPYSGTYTVNDVMSDKHIYVKNVSVNQYTINFLPSERAEYILEGNSAVSSGTKNVNYGETFKFQIKAKTGYKLDDSTAVNCVGYSGSESLLKSKVSGSSSESFVYECTVGNSNTGGVKENKTISVENVENIVYTVSFENVDGVTYLNDTGAVISDSQKVKYGHNFEFSVSIDDAYDDSAAGMFIIVNNGKSSKTSAQKLASGRYIIPNITEDITIKVGNIRKNRYTVTLTKTEGIDYYNDDGKIITGDNEVEQNGTLKFKVSLYPAYEKSTITVMLGDKALPIDSSGFYLVSGVDENKTVTVIGVEKTKEAQLISIIGTLPDSVKNLDDVNAVVEASRIYNSLSDEDKNKITNADILKKLQEQVKAFHHVSNDVRIDGVDWYLKLVVVPISTDAEVCGRIYKKLNSEYILSLYDVYLWDTLNDRKYSFTEDKTVVISVPAPDLTYFVRPTGIHENTNGKIDYLSLTFSNGRVFFETTSFSPMGIIANRSSTPGRSSLLDAVDANVDLIKDYALSNLGGNSSSKSNSIGTAVFDDTGAGNDLEVGSNDNTVEGNISEKYKSRNNRVTFQGSALRLILVLMIIVLISLSLWIFYKQRKQRKKEK